MENKNYFTVTGKSRKEMHRNFAGLIHPSDFDTTCARYMHDEAINIEQAVRWNHQFKRNAEIRKANARNAE